MKYFKPIIFFQNILIMVGIPTFPFIAHGYTQRADLILFTFSHLSCNAHLNYHVSDPSMVCKACPEIWPLLNNEQRTTPEQYEHNNDQNYKRIF